MPLGCGAAVRPAQGFYLRHIPMCSTRRWGGADPSRGTLQTFVAALLIGVLSAYLPARAAARRNIVDALRMVD